MQKQCATQCFIDAADACWCNSKNGPKVAKFLVG